MDRYTKVLLTIIAAALVWLCIKDIEIVENAMASTGIVEVKVVDINFKKLEAGAGGGQGRGDLRKKLEVFFTVTPVNNGQRHPC